MQQKLIHLSAFPGLLLCAVSCFGQATVPTPNEPGSDPFWNGARLLAAFAPRSSVLAVWKSGLRKDTQSSLAKQVANCVPILERQIEEEKILSKDTIENPDQLSLPARIDYYLNRFVDVHGVQMDETGLCDTVSMGVREGLASATPEPDTLPSDSIVRIGRPAIAALIRHLSDTRLTRSYGYRSGYFHILRVQDVAIECIECITKCHFYSHSGINDYFSAEPVERKKDTIREISTWLANGDRSQIDGYKDRLATLVNSKKDINTRIDLISRIEQIDPKAIDSVALVESRWEGEQWKIAICSHS